MKKLAPCGVALFGALLLTSQGGQARPAAWSVEEQNDFVNATCAACHNPTLMMGNLSLRDFDVTKLPERADIAEKMIRKLRAGLMPPPEAPAPPEGARRALAEALEVRLDRAAAGRPDPGWRPFQRLNRAEYARSVRDLLGLDVDFRQAPTSTR